MWLLTDSQDLFFYPMLTDILSSSKAMIKIQEFQRISSDFLAG